MTNPLHRRDFLTRSSALLTGAALGTGALGAVAGPSLPPDLPRTPTDRVTLGQSGVTVSLIGMGTGTVGGGQASNQTKLGVEGFTKLVRHCLDRGITFFDVADQYGSHVFLREALRGVPRDQYVIQTKTHARDEKTARNHIERYRLELGIDYIDVLLLHCMTKGNWPADNAGSMDELMRSREKGLIRAHGVSCHGMDPLRIAAKHPFVQVDLARINPEGLIMDDKSPDEVASELEEMHGRGVGVVGMKILGEGRITEPDRIDASLRFVLGLGTVDAFVIGFESPQQVDDILARTERAIASHAKK
jgi:aryl-alcohol dehydrogenase-like predicted oxidoreductase